MIRFPFLLTLILLTLCTLQPIIAKSYKGSGRSSGHIYPKGGGVSGSGHHSREPGDHGYSYSYPSSHSGRLSGGGSGDPSSGGSHSYPPAAGSHNYPTSGSSHSYPSSKGSYPIGDKGVSRNTQSSSNVHNPFEFNPPKQIVYTTGRGEALVYSVYQGHPPTYVYQYRDSGSRYGTLLAGLALLNLGNLAGTTYYKSQPGEVCKFGVKKSNGDMEVTKIGCELMTSFIFQEQAKFQNNAANTNISTTITIVNTTTVITGVNVQPTATVTGSSYTMLPNATLLPLYVTTNTNVNNTGSTNTTSSVTVTTTVTNALGVKGKDIEVTPEMECFVMRDTASSHMNRSIPCEVLQSSGDGVFRDKGHPFVTHEEEHTLRSATVVGDQHSLKRNSASRHLPTIALMAVVFTIFVAH